MAKVTSKLQVTIPKVIAERYGIAPGQEIEWLQAAEAIRVVPQGAARRVPDTRRRVELYDLASARQRARGSARKVGKGENERGWTREDLYERRSAAASIAWTCATICRGSASTSSSTTAAWARRSSSSS
jgi:bifunctional DNA-binding transcriptional regulator/antitoxin component of YhaV-PrlF toxin-antitoxin module